MTHPQIPALLLVTGPPGAGKTTLARSLAEELDLPLVEKDAIKETIGGALGVADRERSQRLGAAVFELMADVVHDLLRRRVSVIAEGNFQPTSRLLTARPACRVVQVHVRAEPGVLRARLEARDRHGVHYDRAAAAEIGERAAAGEWSALPVDGELLPIDTTTCFPDVRDVASHIAKWLSPSSSS